MRELCFPESLIPPAFAIASGDEVCQALTVDKNQFWQGLRLVVGGAEWPSCTFLAIAIAPYEIMLSLLD